MFNRYESGMYFGSHVDGGMRLIPGTGEKIRTDVSATLFLSAPDEYDGGSYRSKIRTVCTPRNLRQVIY